ncbi:MAG: hypothetical protein M1834_003768 [Cirrosporium novae-zelandiae]|nr:MAG: hypothetical protein M1834_003768 [Cirrosporium novae-zelandiae]
MVVLAASICTRGGKAVLSRQFREIAKSRIEGLLASFPKLADSGTQHTTVEQDNVRYVYQPLDELYMVLITNRQSNILQDIDSLHLFAQVVTSICKSLDEREILRNAFELLSAFDELVTLGYRENLSLTQIKTFLEMESHEERIQEIIARNKELEASEERKRKAKQLELQRKEMARSGRTAMPRPPSHPVYTAPSTPTVTDTYDSYEAEKNRAQKVSTPRGKGMQLGKKSKTTNMFERVKEELGPGMEESAPLVPMPSSIEALASTGGSASVDSDAIHITIAESVTAKLGHLGTSKGLEVKGDLQLRISDPSLTKLRLLLNSAHKNSAQFRTHPNVDQEVFNNSRTIQMKDPSKGFPLNNSVGVLRWRATLDDEGSVPWLDNITFTIWINSTSSGTSIIVEYEWTSGDPIEDVVVSIPCRRTTEPTVKSTDMVYEAKGDSLAWTIGTIDGNNSGGSFEFEAQTEDENQFFPMNVHFSHFQISRVSPFVDVDVDSVILLVGEEDVLFSKEVKLVAEKYVIEREPEP